MELKTSKIHLLDPLVAGKIAAGEVIERPASVVKELVENSIDAGATRIDVELVESGRNLIKVVDNGVGMTPDDISMLFLKHATSKISNLEDLEDINTLGFRGEALSSIGLVSHTRVVSCSRGETAGAEIEVRGGKKGEVKYLGSPEGTLVEVRELFFNVPARRKFLRAVPVEMATISEVLTRMALSHPEIHFTLTHNQREVFNLPPASTLKERIASFFGQDFAKELLFVNSREPALEVSGYIKPPAQNYGNAKLQYTFLNSRYIKEANISHAIQESYRNLLPPGRQPIVFLFLRCNPNLVDVNVHPSKLEARFREPAKVHGQVLQSIKKTLGSIQHTPITLPVPVPQTGGDFPGGLPTTLIQTIQAPQEVAKSTPQRSLSGPYIQVHQSYIVEEIQGGLNIIDQHALHEILLYQGLKQKIMEDTLPVQRLLIPELVELNPNDFLSLMGLQESLCKAGVEIEEFGKNTIIVRSLPQVLKDLEIKEFIKDLLGRLKEEVEGEHILDKVLKAMACKGAIKSGQRLNPQEIQALLINRESSPVVSHCPHGRPTTLFISTEELNKHFKKRTNQ